MTKAEFVVERLTDHNRVKGATSHSGADGSNGRKQVVAETQTDLVEGAEQVSQVEP